MTTQDRPIGFKIEVDGQTIMAYDITGFDKEGVHVRLKVHFNYTKRPKGPSTHIWVFEDGREEARQPGDYARYWPETAAR